MHNHSGLLLHLKVDIYIGQNLSCAIKSRGYRIQFTPFRNVANHKEYPREVSVANNRMKHTNFWSTVYLAMIVALISGCGGKEIGTGTTPTQSSAAAISLTKSAAQVRSDGTDSIIVTASVLDTSSASLAGQAISISSTAGQLSASTATTDAAGKATFTFSGGTSGINRTATITITATGSSISQSLPIQISGSTLTLAGSATVATGTPTTITATTSDAGANAVATQTLRYSVATGSATLSSASGTTNASGSATVSVTGTAAGTVGILVEWLDATGIVTASSTKNIAVTGAATGAFALTTPASSPFAVKIGTNQTVVVSVPSTVAKIRYATSLGSWLPIATQATCNTASQKVCTVTNTGLTDTATFVPGTNAGNSSVQIDALDATGTVMYSANLILSITSPSNSAISITLQSNVAVLPPSVGSTHSTATLTATVRDAVDNPVGGAPVLFELINSTGTGESISPVISTTNSTTPMGEASSTFTAGTSTTQNSSIRASVVGTTITTTKQITVGGTVGSIAIGASTKMTSINSDTAYQLPVTVMVSDSNGNSVSGAVVSLSLWPTQYSKGARVACVAIISATMPNEDTNANLVLNAGEDVDGPGGIPDLALWPPQAAAGTIPPTVTTDANGVATFNWIYLKQYANWVTARLTASTLVQGSQSTASTLIDLTPLAGDVVGTACPLPDSPFN
jgi:hypothetical protein